MLKQAVGVLGTLVVVIVIAAVVLPKQSHAIVATLVQVVNTSANPVPMVMSGTPFEAALCHAFGPTQGTLCGAEVSDFVVPSTTSTGASVKRLVVENISGFCTAENTPLIAGILFSPFVADSVPNSTGAMAHYFPLILQTTGPGPSPSQTERDYSFGGTTRIYFNPGDTVTQRIELFTPSDIDAICFTQVDGTLVTQ
jgi:hypothetical protein